MEAYFSGVHFLNGFAAPNEAKITRITKDVILNVMTVRLVKIIGLLTTVVIADIENLGSLYRTKLTWLAIMENIRLISYC